MNDGNFARFERMGERASAPRLRRGIYNTEYGNSCYVSGPNAKTAYDLDSADRIPISMVTSFIRPVQKGETFGGRD